MNSAVIICGGQGSRLSKSGIGTPKSLLIFHGNSLIYLQIKNLYDFGIRNFIFSLGVGATEIIVHLNTIKEDFCDSNFEFWIDGILGGTAGNLISNFNSLPEEFILIYGDIFIDIDFRKTLAGIKQDFDLVFIYRPSEHPQDSNILLMNDEKRVIEIKSKGDFNFEMDNRLASTGLMLCNKTLFRVIKSVKGKSIDLESDILQKYLNELKIFGTKLYGYARDIGTPNRLKRTLFETSQGLNSYKKSGIIFLDRDGTLNYDIGFFSDPGKLKLLPNVGEAIKMINQSEFYAVVVTNQSGIARNVFTVQQLDEVHNHMHSLLLDSGAVLDNVYFCPHHPDMGFPEEDPIFKKNCRCRKPMPGMLIKAIDDYEIVKTNCWMFGDSLRDINAAKAISINSTLLPTNQKETIDYLEQKVNFNHAPDLLTATRNFFSDRN